MSQGQWTTPNTGFLDKLRAMAADREELPPDPGTVPVPEGHVRLWHYTPLKNVPSIREHGLQRRFARGDAGNGDLTDPSAGMWASTYPPEHLNHSDGHAAVVEFHAHPSEISGNAESPWMAENKREPGQSWEDRTWDSGKLREWNAGHHHVIMRGSVPPEHILAIHEPWHHAARYMRKDDPTLQSYQWVKDDYARGGNDHLEPYVRGLRALEAAVSRPATMSVEDLLALHSNEALARKRHFGDPHAEHGDDTRVSTVYDRKAAEMARNPAAWGQLDEPIRNGTIDPVLLMQTGSGHTVVTEGQHRIVRAHQLGVTHLPVSYDPGSQVHRYDWEEPEPLDDREASLIGHFEAAEADYRMQHQGPDADDGEAMHEVGSGKVYPKDFHEHPEWYIESDGPGNWDSYDKVRRSKDWPSRRVTMYRSMPSPYREVNPGDWVSSSAEYAREHGRQRNPDDDWPVVKFEARADQLRTAGDSINEWSYHGPRINRARVHYRGGRNHWGAVPPGKIDSAVHEHEPDEMYRAYQAQTSEYRRRRREEREAREREASVQHQGISGESAPESEDIFAKPTGRGPVHEHYDRLMEHPGESVRDTPSGREWVHPHLSAPDHGPYYVTREATGPDFNDDTYHVLDRHGRSTGRSYRAGGGLGGGYAAEAAFSDWHRLTHHAEPPEDMPGYGEGSLWNQVRAHHEANPPQFPHSRVDPRDVERLKRPDARVHKPEGHSPSDEYHGSYEVVQHPETGRFHVVDNAGRSAHVLPLNGFETQLQAEQSRDYTERRQRSKEIGKGIAEKLWEGMHQVFDPGSTPESRESDRNLQHGQDLMTRYEGGKGQVKFDSDEEGGAPYYEREHHYENGQGSGWYVKHYGGTHADVYHRGTGDEAAHDMIWLKRHQMPGGDEVLSPGYGDEDLAADLKNWHDEEEGVRAHFESKDVAGYDPDARKIQRWRQRHVGSAPAVPEVVAHFEDGGQPKEAAMQRFAALANPHTGGQDWYHGSPYQFGADEFSAGSASPLEFEPDPEDTSHWNSLIGSHFAASHRMAEEFSKGEHGNDMGHGEEGPARNVLHARLELKSPKVYASEHDMDQDAYEHEWRAGNHHDNYHDPDEVADARQYGAEDELPRTYRYAGHGDRLRAQSEPDPEYAAMGHYHPYATGWLNAHPDKWNIAQRHRQRLIDAGHDGIVYGNEFEHRIGDGKAGNRHICAIPFHDSQVDVTQRHTGEHCIDPESAARQWPGRSQPMLPGFDKEGALDVVAHFEPRTAAGPYLQQKLFHMQPDPTRHEPASMRHNPEDPEAGYRYRKEHDEDYQPDECPECGGDRHFRERHDDEHRAYLDDQDWYTDWEGMDMPSHIHRGMAVHLPQELHDFVHDESRPAAHRAAALASHLVGHPSSDSENGLGHYWSESPDQSKGYAEGRPSWLRPGAGEARERTPVMVHAHFPGREHIETDPETLRHWKVLKYGYARDNLEYPISEGAPIRLSGISWARPDHRHHDVDFPLHKDEAWTHHEFGGEGIQANASLATAAFEDDEDDREARNRFIHPEAACPHCGEPAHGEKGADPLRFNLDGPDSPPVPSSIARCNNCGETYPAHHSAEQARVDREAAEMNHAEYEKGRIEGEELFRHFTPHPTHPMIGWDGARDLVNKWRREEQQFGGPGAVVLPQDSPMARQIREHRFQRVLHDPSASRPVELPRPEGDITRMSALQPGPDQRSAAEERSDRWHEYKNSSNDHLHRGIITQLPEDLHSYVHDESVPREQRAQALAQHFAGSGEGLGMHWTPHPRIAERAIWNAASGDEAGRGAYASEHGGWDDDDDDWRDEDDEGDPGSPHTAVMFHATTGQRNKLPEREHEQYGIGWAHSRDEDEFPVRPGSPMRLHGISWKQHDPQYPNEPFEHVDFPKPIRHVSSRKAEMSTPVGPAAIEVVAHFGVPGHFEFYGGEGSEDGKPRTTELEEHLHGHGGDLGHHYRLSEDVGRAWDEAYNTDPRSQRASRYHQALEGIHQREHERMLRDAQEAVQHGANPGHPAAVQAQLESEHHQQWHDEQDARTEHQRQVAEHLEDGEAHMHGRDVPFSEMIHHLVSQHGIPHDALPEHRLPDSDWDDPYRRDLEEMHEQHHADNSLPVNGTYRHTPPGQYVTMHWGPRTDFDAEHHLVSDHGFDIDELRHDEPDLAEAHERDHAQNRRYLDHHLYTVMDPEGHLPHHEHYQGPDAEELREGDPEHHFTVHSHDEQGVAHARVYHAEDEDHAQELHEEEHPYDEVHRVERAPVIPPRRQYTMPAAEHGAWAPTHGPLQAPGDEPDYEDTAHTWTPSAYHAPPRSREELWAHLKEHHGVTQSADSTKEPGQAFMQELHSKMHYGEYADDPQVQARATPHQHDFPEGHDPVFGSASGRALVAHFGERGPAALDPAARDTVLAPPAGTFAPVLEALAAFGAWEPQSTAEAVTVLRELDETLEALREGLQHAERMLEDAPLDPAVSDALHEVTRLALAAEEDYGRIARMLPPEATWETPGGSPNH